MKLTLLVQIQQWKYQNNVWNLFKVNSVFIVDLEQFRFDLEQSNTRTYCSSVSIVDFEQIDAGWVSERGIRQQLGICWLTFGLDNKLTPSGLESSAQSKVPL